MAIVWPGLGKSGLALVSLPVQEELGDDRHLRGIGGAEELSGLAKHLHRGGLVRRGEDI